MITEEQGEEEQEQEEERPDEVWLGGVEGGHQGVQLLGVEGGDGLVAAALLLLPLLGLLLLPALPRVVPGIGGAL